MPTEPASIVGAFLENAKRTPEKAAITFEGRAYTYARLRQR